jgi:hypothetical protein
MRVTTREQITPSVQPRPHSQTSLLRILAMPNPRCKFARIYCARSLEIPFLPWAHRRDLEADCPCYCVLWTKNEPRRGSSPARAAQGMATTSYCGKFLPDRGQKISCRFSLMAARLAAQQIESRRAGLAIDYFSLRCIGGPPPTPPLVSFWFCSQGRTADSDRRAALANGYWFLLMPPGTPVPPPLASLLGFRSRTST